VITYGAGGGLHPDTDPDPPLDPKPNPESDPEPNAEADPESDPPPPDGVDTDG